VGERKKAERESTEGKEGVCAFGRPPKKACGGPAREIRKKKGGAKDNDERDFSHTETGDLAVASKKEGGGGSGERKRTAG